MSDPTKDCKENENLLVLLQEYTSKLRSVCKDREDSRFRLAQAQAMGGVFVTMVLIIALLYSDVFVGMTKNPLLILNVVALPALGAFAIWLMLLLKLQTRSSNSSDAHRIAASLERLVQISSQLNEHSTKRIGDKLEWDLRIGEAEGTLRHYQRVFRVDGRHFNSPLRSKLP